MAPLPTKDRYDFGGLNANTSYINVPTLYICICNIFGYTQQLSVWKYIGIVYVPTYTMYNPAQGTSVTAVAQTFLHMMGVNSCIYTTFLTTTCFEMNNWIPIFPRF